MPQHKGVEPFSYVWILQVRVKFLPASIFCCTQCDPGKYFPVYLSIRLFTTEQAYLNYKSWISAQPNHLPYIEIVTDYGRCRWFNDKDWISFQMNDIVINGNFFPTQTASVIF